MDANWDDLKTVLAVMRQGTLAAAGQVLGVNYTTVARRIARAEQALGQQLFERLADGYHPTEAARLIAEKAALMEQEADDMLRQLTGRDPRLNGELVVTAPQLLISHFLAPMLQQFRQIHPDIRLRLRATNQLLDLNRREADLAIRISRSPGDSLMGQRLSAQFTASFATAAWAERIADDPEAPIDWLLYEHMEGVPKLAMERYPSSRVHLEFDDMVAMAGAAAAGLGVVRLPLFLGRGLGLVQVPLLPPQPYAEIWMVAHRDVWGGGRVAAFRSLAQAFFKQNGAVFT